MTAISRRARYGRTLVKLLFAAMMVFFFLPVAVTLIASFASSWTGVFPSGFVSFENWRIMLGLEQRAAGGAKLSLQGALGYSVLLALGGVAINLVVGVPIAYAVARYDFAGSEWVKAFAILPLAPGVILGVAFLRTYPTMLSEMQWLPLIVGYSLLKAPYMVMAVMSSFESMPLQQLEESARSLGASWPRTFLTVIVPNARQGIIAGSIISWTLAAAEFNFSYIVVSGTSPLSLFLYRNITFSTFLTAASAISMFFLIVAGIIVLLQLLGTRGFTTAGLQE